MNEKNTLALVAAAPLLYRLYGTETGWSIKYGFACGDGWFDILLRLSVKLEAELQAMLAAGKRKQDLPVAEQVKEKFGKLRFYVGRQPAHWREWIEEAMVESGRTCELCGQPGGLSIHGGWAATLCPRHRILSGHVPREYGEVTLRLVGDEESPIVTHGTPREGMDFLGIVRLATGNLDVWAPAGKGLNRGVIFAGDLPPALGPALSKLANEQDQIPVEKVVQYIQGNRWLPNVRAVLGLPAVEPGEFVEEAEQMIRHEEMELVGSVVLPLGKGAVPVFEPFESPGLKIVPRAHMPEWVAEEFGKFNLLAAMHPLGAYVWDFERWVRTRLNDMESDEDA